MAGNEFGTMLSMVRFCEFLMIRDEIETMKIRVSSCDPSLDLRISHASPDP